MPNLTCSDCGIAFSALTRRKRCSPCQRKVESERRQRWHEANPREPKPVDPAIRTLAKQLREELELDAQEGDAAAKALLEALRAP